MRVTSPQRVQRLPTLVTAASHPDTVISRLKLKLAQMGTFVENRLTWADIAVKMDGPLDTGEF